MRAEFGDLKDLIKAQKIPSIEIQSVMICCVNPPHHLCQVSLQEIWAMVSSHLNVLGIW